MPETTMHEVAGPDSSVCAEALLDEVVSHEVQLDEVLLDHAVSDEDLLEEVVLDETVNDEAPLDEAVRGEAVRDEAPLDEAVRDEAVRPEDASPQVALWEEVLSGAAHSPVGYGRCAGCGQVKVLDERGRPFPHNRYRYHRRLRVQRCPGERLPATPYPSLAEAG